MLTTYERHAKRKLTTLLLAVIVIAGFVIFSDQTTSKANVSRMILPSQTATTQPAASAPAVQTSPTTAQTTTSTTSNSFRDGEYSTTSSYYVPNSVETIKVNLTLKSGVITDVSIQNSESDNQSANYQQSFASIYKDYVIGQKISNLQLDVVAGASDTTRGFIDATNSIATKARA